MGDTNVIMELTRKIASREVSGIYWQRAVPAPLGSLGEKASILLSTSRGRISTK